MRILPRGVILIGALLICGLLYGQAAASPAPRVSAQAVGEAYREATRLTNRFAKRFLTHDSGHFTMVYTSETAWALETAELLEATKERFFSDLTGAGFRLRQPEERLLWICFSDRDDFSDYAREVDRVDMSWLEGYYSARTNRVVLKPRRETGSQPVTQEVAFSPFAPGATGVDAVGVTEEALAAPAHIDVRRTVHEAAHQLAFNTGLQTRGVMYPFWVAEGLATNFEADALEDLRFGGDNPTRQRHLRRARVAGRLMPLEEFVAFTRLVPGQGYETRDVYAQAWGLFNFLYNHHPAQLRQYLANLARIEPGARNARVMQGEFEAAFGPIWRLEPAWREYLLLLDSMNALASDTAR